MPPPTADAEAPAVVADLVRRAESAGASDLHLQTATDRSAQVSFRLDGLLAPVVTLPAGLAERVFGRLKYLAKLQTWQDSLPQDGRIKMRVQGREIDVRVSTLPTVFGDVEIDLCTCYVDQPAGFTGRVFNINEYGGAAGRDKLLADLAARNYSIAGILCSGEPIMTKWKWWLTWKLPAKVFIINENADFFWVDWRHRKLMRQFVLTRAGLLEDGAVRKLGEPDVGRNATGQRRERDRLVSAY